MPSDYTTIENENRERYGWDIERIGKMLLADRYDDRTHFLYELLQNAEDAISWRPLDSKLPKNVSIKLLPTVLEFSHYGLPFEDKHVRGICGIGESTKEGDLTTIGRFGIGFKSVYAFTKRPEIHSGEEHFAIDAFVRPCQIPERPTASGQTLFHIPFETTDKIAFEQLQDRLDSMGHRTLLFLKQIEAIEWESSGTGGNYLRESEPIQENFRKVTILGQRAGETSTKMERWLVFSRSVKHGDEPAGQVEIAFCLSEEPGTKKEIVIPIADSRLVVFFPTIVETHLGFLIQGPYRTTPSRDNIPKDDSWNRHLISETAILVKEALIILRDQGYLSVSVLNAMPLDREKFQGVPNLARLEHMCMPIFKAVKNALLDDNLLPKYESGFASGRNVKIARTDGLRKLLLPTQIAQLYSSPVDLFWLSEEITRDKTAQLRQYLIGELGINEMDPDAFLARFTEDFIKQQSDEWVARFYAFLLDQPALWRIGGFRLKPILRLESGAHVTPLDASGHPQAFLPTEAQSGFPQVKRSLVQDTLALKFLKQIGLTAPDPVDDVIFHVLPTFNTPPSHPEYRDRFGRILAASETDSSSQREKLIAKLKQTACLRCRNAATDLIDYRLPESIYFATDKLTTLFASIETIWFLDDQSDSHRGDLPRKLLEACGVRDYLRRFPVTDALPEAQKNKLRQSEGAVNHTWDNEINFEVDGLSEAAKKIAALPYTQAHASALNLWQVLIDTLREGRETFFHGSYIWGYYQNRWTANFPAKFLTDIHQISWLPGPDNKLASPSNLRFSQLPPAFQALPSLAMQSLLGFKPEVIHQLAIESGVDLATIELLKKHDISTEQLLQMLQQAGVEVKFTSPANPEPQTTQLAASDPNCLSTPDQLAAEPSTEPSSGNNSSNIDDNGGNDDDDFKDTGQPARASSGKKNPHTSQHQDGEFVTYIYTHPDNDEKDKIGNPAEDERRQKLGQAGLEAVLAYERSVGRNPKAMPHTNEGYDVASSDANGEVERYIEVKTPGSNWGLRGVTLSDPQFRTADLLEESFWLYVVENAGTLTQRIYRIKNPAKKIKHYAFNSSWRVLAEPDTIK